MTHITLTLGFLGTPDAQGKRKISCRLEGELPEHQQIVLFDVFYAQTLHRLEPTLAQALREDMEAWAVQFSSKIFLPMEKIVQAGLDRIDPSVIVVQPEIQYQDATLTLFVACPEGEWAVIERIEDRTTDIQQRLDAVKGLAQYFFIENKLFRRELAIHILAMRKYYEDGQPPSVPESMLEAPLYALHKALAYFQSVERGEEGRFLH